MVNDYMHPCLSQDRALASIPLHASSALHAREAGSTAAMQELAPPAAEGLYGQALAVNAAQVHT